ncbi:hypothetical protein [Moraxella lacunata]|uniref:hypothetical protein n=1 Tax=Moraxella lacunata TaxID=477 RepID=UPI003EE3BB5C
MIFKLELYQLITLAIALCGTLWGVGKAFFNRVESSIKEKDETLAKALSTLGDKLDKESEAIRHLDRELLKLKAELPREFVAKEDFVRSFTVVEAKIDAVQTTLTQFAKDNK